MHDNELDIDQPLVRRLLRAQFPQWAALPLKPVGAGTAHVMMRLGDDLVVRLPRTAGSTDVELEQTWLPYLAPHLPLPVPVPMGHGTPTSFYPAKWSVQQWLPGDHDFTDLRSCALQLAAFLTALREIDPDPDRSPERVGLADDRPRDQAVGPGRAPAGYRGGRPTGWDDAVQRGLRDFDVPGGEAFWRESWQVPDWDGPAVWTHGDLLPTNLLASDGRLAAVLDFGCAGIGDPACDLMPAWTLFDDDSRPLFRAATGADDATWERGRAWAFAFGLSAWHYYVTRNPPFSALGHRTVNRVLTSR